MTYVKLSEIRNVYWENKSNTIYSNRNNMGFGLTVTIWIVRMYKVTNMGNGNMGISLLGCATCYFLVFNGSIDH